MKIFLMISLALTSLFAEIDWMKYSKAVEKAKKENKFVMIMLSKEGCPACEYMENVVFENEDVLDEFNKDFIGVHLDIHNDYVPGEFSYIGTPTFHFINKNERRIDRIDGGANAKEFLDKIKEVKNNN